MKYVLVTGGVVSGLGKGVTASSIGLILKACGLRVTAIKIGICCFPSSPFLFFILRPENVSFSSLLDDFSCVLFMKWKQETNGLVLIHKIFVFLQILIVS